MLNRILDAFVATSVARPHGVPVYVVWGVTGITVGTVLGAALGAALGTPFSVLATIAVTAGAALVAAGRIRRARGRHVLVEDLAIVLGSCALVAWTLGGSVLATLDFVTLGFGAMLAFCRLGCLAAGCCHGRPARWGVRYGPASSIPDPLVGVRLFPSQLVEALWIAVVTAVGFVLALTSPAGEAAWWWLLAYLAGRFVLEFVRGDLRPVLGPLSEAQWLAIVAVAARIVWEETSPTPGRNTRLLALGGAVAVLLLVYATRRRWWDRPAPVFSPADADRWRTTLEELEDEALRRDVVAGGSDVAERPGPGPGLRITLAVQDAPGGAELHSYCLFDESGEPPAAPIVWAFAGWATQRLPAHQVLRADWDHVGAFQLWVLVRDPLGPPGSTESDAAWFVAQRARAFADSARTAPPAAARPAGPFRRLLPRIVPGRIGPP